MIEQCTVMLNGQGKGLFYNVVNKSGERQEREEE
jgi:hypothetical protein